jgi:hypothetical protein
MSENAALYYFDIFSGFPEASVREEVQATGLVVYTDRFSDTSRALVAKTIASQVSPPRVVLRQGEFSATFASLEHRKWRFVFARRGPLRTEQD